MKEYRPALLGLLLILVLLAVGCDIRTPPSSIQAVISTPELPTPATTVDAALITATIAIPEREDTIQDSFHLTVNADGYADLSANQLHHLLPEHKFTLVNVHIPYQGEIPETDLFIPFDKIADQQGQLPAKDAPIVLYCKTGPMSIQAAKTLADLGYRHIYTLNGGFDAWGADKYELLNKKQ